MPEIIEKLASLAESSRAKYNVHIPVIYRMTNADDQEKIYRLLETPGITVLDELHGQLEELVKSKYPKRKLKGAVLAQTAREHLGTIPSEDYGVWVYYPWSNRLVHILDEEEFVFVRTNRNKYKITQEECDRLSKVKLGVIGLSVGQAVSVTMAMERSFGEIRLADFDILELTNLNRIRIGVHHLGVSKAVSVAREIAEIDPYLKVVCFTDGLTEENMDRFFTEGGNLDMLVDECDGLDIKILCRFKARELGIPVVMDMSDRGTLDVERFDLEPNRPILHGLVDHLDLSKIGGDLTNEEKIPYLLAMIGEETLSHRLKASMIEVGQTISTWPQLASGVALGGALTGDVCRRIILDQYHESGRYWVDLESLVGDAKKTGFNEEEKKFLVEPVESLELTAMKQTAAEFKSVKEHQLTLDQDTVSKLVTSAALAPSGGNNQPWKWLYQDGNLYLFHDYARTVSLLDFNKITAYIGLGAATENLVLQAHAQNLDVTTELFPGNEDSSLVAIVRFFPKGTVSTAEPHAVDELVSKIPFRLTNRKIVDRQPIFPEKLEKLIQTSRTIPGANLSFISGDGELEELGNLIASIERSRLMHPQGHTDFVHEIRWTQEQIDATRDGIGLDTIDISESDLTGLRVSREWEVVRYIKEWGGGDNFEKLFRKAVAGASVLGCLTMPKFDKADYFNGGRALQRIWLRCSELNIGFQPQSPITFLFARLLHGNGEGLPVDMQQEIAGIRTRFEKIFPVVKDAQEIFLFRLHVADEPKERSLRLPLEDVLFFN